MLNLNHKNLEVWKKSIVLVKEIYKLTDSLPAKESYGLTSQIRRAAVSIPSNIAEGAARKSDVEQKRFFEMSRSSLVEIDTQIEISKELDFIKKEDTGNLEKLIIEIFSMLSALIKNS